jgi:peptide deformylase
MFVIKIRDGIGREDESMALREIRTVGDPVLREKARRVNHFGPEVERLLDDMIETMQAAPGVGLAAPQIAVSERMIVIEAPKDEEDTEAGTILYEMVNPEIVKVSREVVDDDEGCLSIPGYVGEVPRHAMIVVRGQDRFGRPVRVRAYDYLARVFQHEIDHLDGILFIDRVTSPDKIRKIEPGEHLEGEAAEAAAALETVSA